MLSLQRKLTETRGDFRKYGARMVAIEGSEHCLKVWTTRERAN